MRVLVLLSSFFPCGQTTHVVSLCESLRQSGQEVHLVVTHPETNPDTMRKYMEYLSSVGVTTNIISFQRPEEIVSFCNHKKIDIIHAHSSWDFNIANSIHARVGIPYILTCHGLGLNNQRLRGYLDKAAYLICVGPRVADSLKEYGNKVVLMQNAVDLNRFKPSEKAELFTVVYAGRYDQSKRAGIEALATAIDTFPDPIQFFLAGDRNCSKYARRHGRYVEWETRIESYMNKSHVVIGTGRAIREGMAAGNACMVLGWQYDGIVTPDSFAANKFADFSGRCHQGAMDAREIQSDLLRLCRDRTQLLDLQRFSRSYAEENFDLHQSTLQTIDIYQESVAVQKLAAAKK